MSAKFKTLDQSNIQVINNRVVELRWRSFAAVKHVWVNGTYVGKAKGFSKAIALAQEAQ